MAPAATRLDEHVADALAPLPAEYADLLARIVPVLRDDPAVVAAWVGGSVARGVADAGSDLDLLITLADDPDAWLAHADALRAVVDPVITVAVGTRIAAYTTRAGLRVDVVVESDADLATSPFRRRIALFGGDERVGRIPDPHADERGPDAGKVSALITEFLRQQAIFPAAVVARADWLLGQEGVHNTRQLLYELFVEINQPLPPMGVKQWSAKLTTEQRDTLAALVPPVATRASVIEAMTHVRAEFLRAARAACAQVGADWPSEPDEAVAAYWRRSGLIG